MECPRFAALRERQRRRFQERINTGPGFKAKVSERSKELYRKNPDRRRPLGYTCPNKVAVAALSCISFIFAKMMRRCVYIFFGHLPHYIATRRPGAAS